MSVKTVEVAGVGTVKLYRRKGVRGVRMSIRSDGDIRVSLPPWAPYRLGIEFVRDKSRWIAEQRKTPVLLQNGDRVGKAHRLVFLNSEKLSKPTYRIISSDIRVILPVGVKVDSTDAQKTATRAAIRALKQQAEQLLTHRLAVLAKQHGFMYRYLTIKQLKSRWGSCNEKTDIVLNCYLMQLPWHLIDYVLLHELVHTKVLRHGEPFWQELSKYVPNLKAIKKEMKTHKPSLETIPMDTAATNSKEPVKLAIEII